jgi:hypothetical protein
MKMGEATLVVTYEVKPISDTQSLVTFFGNGEVIATVVMDDTDADDLQEHLG